MGSPVGGGGGGSFRTSTESLKHTVSKQSLLDMVSSKINVHRNRTPQRYFSRESLAAGCANRITDLDVSKLQKTTPRYRNQERRPTLSQFKTLASSPIHTENGGNGNMSKDLITDKSSTTSSKRRKKRRHCGMRWTFVFDPAGRLTYYWHMVVSLAFLYNLWVIIFRFAFCEITRETIVIWFSFDYLSDFVYVMDVMINFRVGFLEDGVLQTDTTKLRQNYMNTTTFYFDCLCLLPLDFLYLSIGFNSILRLCRLVKVYKFSSFMDRTERHSNYPNVFRAVSLLHYLLVTYHWNGCIYHILFKTNKFGNRNWAYLEPPDSNDTLRQYLQSFYWCTLALTTIGDLPRPHTNFEYGFVIVQMLFGLLLFATVLGHVSSIVVNVSAARKEFQAKLDNVKQYMRTNKVPDSLETKVIKWFDYLWLTQKNSDEEKAISCLPDKFKAEIAMNVHLDTLKRVEIFQNTEAGFLRELVVKLKHELFSPGDYICRKGEVGKEMYIVSCGKLQVVADDGKTVLATLKAGSYFGEISILNMGTAGNRRTASVRSVGYSDLFVLSKKDMWDVLKEYPAARIRLEEVATRRLEKYREDPDPYDIAGLFGRRCRSTPGIIESHDRMSLEEMWLTPHINSHRYYRSSLEPPSIIGRTNGPTASPSSARSSGHSSDNELRYRDRNKYTIPTISQTVSENAGLRELPEVVMLKAEINRLQDQLKDVEKQNRFLNEKLTQQQWNMDHRLAEIELQICRDTASSIGSSGDENERNRESVI